VRLAALATAATEGSRPALSAATGGAPCCSEATALRFSEAISFALCASFSCSSCLFLSFKTVSSSLLDLFGAGESASLPAPRARLGGVGPLTSGRVCGPV